MDLNAKKLIVLVGPTGVGKSEVALQLAKHFGTEIISTDSRQFYKELNIGTAKPSSEELKTIRHHFINSHSITDDYDAARFGNDALKCITKLFENYDYLMVCGGSGLYIKALLEGFDEIPKIPEAIRDEISTQYNQKGLSWLQSSLREIDPEYYKSVDEQNPARLMRALEVAKGTGKSIASFHTNQKKVLPFKVLKIGLELNRNELYARINARMDRMIESGLFEEAKSLYPFRQHNALQTVGYTEIFDFMDDQYNMDEAIRLLKRNSRRYAKRQLTWFKRDAEINWFRPDQITEIKEYIRNF